MALSAYWKKHPPVHLLVAAYCGYNSQQEGENEKQGDLAELLEMCPDGALKG